MFLASLVSKNAAVAANSPMPIKAFLAWVTEGMLNDVKQLDNSLYKTFAKRLEQLTPHQFRVLQLMADGLLNKQIAYELQVSESTIKQHVSAVLNKLGFNNRTQAGVMFKSVMITGDGG